MIVLLLVPALYLIVEDAKDMVVGIFGAGEEEVVDAQSESA
ncbi:MAG: hypothetical protein AAF654_13955 [Myxococcota bacterium]